MSQFAQDHAGFTYCPSLIINSIPFTLKSSGLDNKWYIKSNNIQVNWKPMGESIDWTNIYQKNVGIEISITNKKEFKIKVINTEGHLIKLKGTIHQGD